MTYRAGLLILTFTVLLSSINGVMMRLAQDPEPWPAVVGRYLAQAAGMTLYIAWRSRGRLGARFVAMGLPGIVTSVCYGLGSVGFLVALSLTTVAETMFVLSAMPVVTAIAARLLLGERVRRSAWIAMAGSAVGIAVMFGDNAGNCGSTAGLLVAIVCVLFMAGFGVGLRWALRRAGEELGEPLRGDQRLAHLVRVGHADLLVHHGTCQVEGRFDGPQVVRCQRDHHGVIVGDEFTAHN